MKKLLLLFLSGSAVLLGAEAPKASAPIPPPPPQPIAIRVARIGATINPVNGEVEYQNGIKPDDVVKQLWIDLNNCSQQLMALTQPKAKAPAKVEPKKK